MVDEPGHAEDGFIPDLQHEPLSADIPIARPIPTHPSPPLPDDDHPLLLSAATRGSAWRDIAAVVLLVVALDVLGGFAMQAAALPPELPEDIAEEAVRTVLFAPLVVTRMIVVLISVSIVLYCRKQTFDSIGLAFSRCKMNLLVGIGATAVAYALIFAWQMAIWSFWPGLWDQMNENAERIMGLVPKPDHPIWFVPPALAVGVYEELLFRGFLMTRLRRALGGWTFAVILSTAIFTSLHAVDQTPAALVPVTILSVVFSLATIWRRSVIPAIVGHVLFNSFNLIGLYYMAGESWT